MQRFGAVPTLIEWDTDIPTLDVLLAEAAQAQAVLSATREVTVMNSLAAQQQTLLKTLFEASARNAINLIAAYADSTGARGLKVYQTNGHMLAERALQAAYPVVVQLIGEESLAGLARAFWHAHPPQRGDLAQWGAELPEFVRPPANNWRASLIWPTSPPWNGPCTSAQVRQTSWQTPPVLAC